MESTHTGTGLEVQVMRKKNRLVALIVVAALFLAGTVYGGWNLFNNKKVQLQKDYNGIIVGSNINMRDTPTSKGTIVHTYDPMELVTILENTSDVTASKPEDMCGYQWQKIKDSQGRVGWVFGQFVFHLDQGVGSVLTNISNSSYVEFSGQKYLFGSATDLSTEVPGSDDPFGCDKSHIIYFHHEGQNKVEPIYFNPKQFSVESWERHSNNYVMLSDGSEGGNESVNSLEKIQENGREVLVLKVYYQGQDGGQENVIRIGMNNNHFEVLEYIEGEYMDGNDLVASQQHDTTEQVDDLYTFTKDAAMIAIFGAYNEEHDGSLLPNELTENWDDDNAKTHLKFMFMASYKEDGKTKGAFLVKRFTSSVDGLSTPDVLIYLFKQEGDRWVFEKRREDIHEFESAEEYPAEGRLIKLGDDKYGVLFEGSFGRQGSMSSYSTIIGLSEGSPSISTFSLGESNAGNCSSDEETREDAESCWEYKGEMEFLRQKRLDHYILKVSMKGTEEDDKGGIEPVDKVDYYSVAADGYTVVDADVAKGATVVQESRIFVDSK